MRAKGTALRSKTMIYCFSHLRWNFVFQRPQHLLTRAAVADDVVFIEEPRFAVGARSHLESWIDQSGVRVVTPVLPEGLPSSVVRETQRRLLDELVADADPNQMIGWYYTPMALPFSRHVPFRVVVYDNMDELAAFKGASPAVREVEAELLARSDVVFTGGQSLFEAKCDRHSNIYAFPSSIDAPHFMAARKTSVSEPIDQQHIARPRFGYFGVIDERMDLDLLSSIAHLRAEWQFVMIGPTAKIDPEVLPRRNNIHWLGGKSYRELPYYLSGWNIGIMPFALNEATRFISPTKTPEFLAAGIPVVSTPIADVVRPYGELKLIEIAADPNAFVTKAELLLKRPRAEWLGRVDAHLAQNSWDLTWERMDGLIRTAWRQGTRYIRTEAAE